MEENNKCKLIIPQGCRSDWGLSDPIIKRLRSQEWCEVIVIDLKAASFGDSYFKAKSLILHYEPDVVLCVGDRIEMCAAACAAFHTNTSIIHYGSGTTNYPIATLDDVNRHCITLWSDVQLCEDKLAAINTLNLLEGIKDADTYVVGHTHCDDIVTDESLVPDYEYDLVLYNPTTMYNEEIPEILVENKSKNKVIWIGSNPDPHYLLYKYEPLYYENLPRPQFLGLLKNCERFITNSSCAYYEAPLWLKPEQIIIIGDRNCSRSTKFEGKPGASDKIVQIIKDWWLNK